VKTFRIAIYGTEESLVHPEIKKISSEIQYLPYDIEQMLEPLVMTPDVILCYPPKDDLNLPALEIAQTLRSIYMESPLYFISLDKKSFDKKRLIKNGFTQAFLLPWEKADLIRSMNDEQICSLLPELRDYKAIKVADIKPGVVLDFGMKVYLPRSNKLLPFSHEGDPISEDKFQKLAESKMNTLFVKKDEVEKFRQYTAKIFKDLMSETDKQDKLEVCVRDLISDMFIEDVKENTFAASQVLLKEVKDIISILIEDAHKEIAPRVNTLINQEQNFYLHLSNVSTYGGLFAMVLGLPNPQDVALAGLLHDIGKINLPPEIADLPESDLSQTAIEAYKKHSEFTIDVLKLRRIALPQPAMNAILHHHEAVNGTGYPKGLEGPRISKEGKVLAIANEFDNLTSMQPGKLSLSPRAALELMLDNNIHKSMKLDLDMLKKLKSVFLK
jgi:HD-GYP domain-containing protein (c-di-GMP phosphodiesterase class II)